MWTSPPNASEPGGAGRGGPRRLTRGELLRQGALALAGGMTLAALGGCATGESTVGSEDVPAAQPRPVAPARFTGTLHVLGLPVDLIEPVRAAAELDLDFRVVFEVTDSVSMVQRALTDARSFHLLSAYMHQIDQIWPSGNFVGIDRSRLRYWELVNPMLKLGLDAAGRSACAVGDGDAPFRKLYTSAVHETGELVTWASDSGSAPDRVPEPPALTAVPTTFGLDSLAFAVPPVDKLPEEVSWAELFDERWRGRVGMLNDPSSFQDAAIAAQAAGLMRFEDTGRLTVPEIDALTELLVEMRRTRQIAHLWTTFDEAVDLFTSGQVVLGPTWSSAASYLHASGLPIRYAAPPEGYRAWCGGLCLSRAALEDERVLEACYEYFNWWHAGRPGAMMARYGFYNAVQETSRVYLEPGEWDYWLAGKPAPASLDSAYGDDSIAPGEVRDGGSLEERSCRIAAWLSHFDGTTEYQIARWNDLLEA